MNFPVTASNIYSFGGSIPAAVDIPLKLQFSFDSEYDLDGKSAVFTASRFDSGIEVFKVSSGNTGVTISDQDIGITISDEATNEVVGGLAWDDLLKQSEQLSWALDVLQTPSATFSDYRFQGLVDTQNRRGNLDDGLTTTDSTSVTFSDLTVQVNFTDTAAATAFPEAPIDGLYYGRTDATWGQVTEEAPEDGLHYTRVNGAWQVSPITPVTGLSLQYRFQDDTSATDPGAGNLKVNNLDQLLATELYVNIETRLGANAEVVWENFREDDILAVQETTTQDEFIIYTITGPPVNNVGWFTFPVSRLAIDGDGGVDDNAQVVISPIKNPADRLPPNGDAGQVLTKDSSTSFDTSWQDAASGAAWGDITGTLSNQTDLQDELDGRYKFGDSPTFDKITATGEIDIQGNTAGSYFHDGRIVIGTAASPSENSGLLKLTHVYSETDANHHSIVVATNDPVLKHGGGNAAFDSSQTISSPNNLDHFVDFQARGRHSGAGSITNIHAFFSRPSSDGNGCAFLSHFDAYDATGTGSIINQFGLRVGELTRGTNNWAVYTTGNTPSYFGGDVTFGGAIGTASSRVSEGFFAEVDLTGDISLTDGATIDVASGSGSLDVNGTLGINGSNILLREDGALIMGVTGLGIYWAGYQEAITQSANQINFRAGGNKYGCFGKDYNIQKSVFSADMFKLDDVQSSVAGKTYIHKVSDGRVGIGTSAANLSDGTLELADIIASGDVDFTGLPTSDPASAGRLWVDSTADYAIKVSQG
jgi:hypothetical protein